MTDVVVNVRALNEASGQDAAAASDSAELSQAWAEGTEPGGPGTKSAEEHASDAGTQATAAATSAAQAALYDGVWLDNSAAIDTDETLSYGPGASGVSEGDYVRTRAEGFSYQVAASGATDHHLTTAGGVKLSLVEDGQISPEMTNAKGDGVSDDTSAFTILRDGFPRREIQANGTYAVSDLRLMTTSIRGSGTLKAVAGASYVLGLGYDTAANWRYASVRDLCIDGNSKASDGIDFNAGGTNDHFAGRWDIERTFIRACAVGINKRFGSIGNNYRSVSVNSCDIGYRAVDNVGDIMHSGADYFQGGEFSSNALAAFLIDSESIGTGGTTIGPNVIVEGNPGFGVFVRNWRTSYVPFVIDGAWFEDNASAGSVTIDGIAYAPKDIRLDNTAYAVIRNSPLTKVAFNGSTVLLDGCFVNDTTVIEVSNSNVRAINLNTDGMKGQPIEVESIAKAQRTAGAQADSYRCVPRTSVKKALSGSGVVNSSRSCDGTTGITFSGSSTLTSTQVSDGLLFPYAAEVVQPNGHTIVFDNKTLTAGKWTVYTFDWKQVSGNPSSINLTNSITLANNFRALTKANQWVTMGGVAKIPDGGGGSVALYVVNNSGASQTFRLGCYQIVQFDSEAEAVAFFNAQAFVDA